MPAAAVVPKLGDADRAQAVRERANAYYAAFLSGDRAAAEQMVAPESRQAFRQLHLDTLVGAKVTNVEMAGSGDSAAVTVLHTYQLQHLMDVDFHQNWKLIDGQWYFVLPVASGPTETPFGTMTFPGHVSPADQAAMQKMIEERNKNIDPDQYEKALAKVAKTEREKEAQRLAAAQAQQEQAEAAAKAKADAEKAAKTKGKKKSKKPVDDSSKSASTNPEQKPPDQTRNQ